AEGSRGGGLLGGLAVPLDEPSFLRVLIELVLHLVGIVHFADQVLDGEKVSTLAVAERNIRRGRKDRELGLVGGPSVQPDPSELETAVQVTELRRGKPRAFALLSLHVRSGAWVRGPVRKDLESPR